MREWDLEEQEREDTIIIMTMEDRISELQGQKKILSDHIDSMRTQCLQLEAIIEIVKEPDESLSEKFLMQSLGKYNRIRQVLGLSALYTEKR